MEKIEISRNTKLRLILHLVITIAAFFCFVVQSSPGLGLFVFAVVEAVSMLVVVRDRRAALICVPIVILCANSFFYASYIWLLPNFLVILALLALMSLTSRRMLDVRDVSMHFLGDVICTVFGVFRFFGMPFVWVFRNGSGRFKKVRTALLALLITIPSLCLIIVLLGQADDVFSILVGRLSDVLSSLFNGALLPKLYISLLVGLYLFSTAYATHMPKPDVKSAERPTRIFSAFAPNVLLASVIAVYAIFVAIQVKYLLLGAALPQGLTYSAYARKGFFELLFLSGFNIVIMLVSVRIARSGESRWHRLITVFCTALCAITLFLLVSSFFRMYLYSAAYGLTRLRLFVFGFLIFEGIGLAATFFYILRPRFNIVMLYCALALSYYLVLNVANTDAIVAKSQVDRYLAGKTQSIEYITGQLSADAASQIARLAEADDRAHAAATEYFGRITENRRESWQAENLSIRRAARLAENFSN